MSTKNETAPGVFNADVRGEVVLCFEYEFLTVRVAASGSWAEWWQTAHEVMAVVRPHIPGLQFSYELWARRYDAGECTEGPPEDFHVRAAELGRALVGRPEVLLELKV